MRIDMVLLSRMGLLYLFLPVLIFLTGWVRVELALPCSLMALVALKMAWRNDAEGEILPSAGLEGTKLQLPVLGLLIVIAVAVAWCAVCGQGGLVVQKGDWFARNALFRDLITHRWPVFYPRTDGTLSYYVGHWLPAGAVGKLVLMLGGSNESAWRIGYLALFAWTAFGVLLTWLVLLAAVRIDSSVGWVCAFMALFILFGGMDALGILFRQAERWMAGLPPSLARWRNMDNGWSLTRELHWGKGFQFSSMTTLLSWVFNQTVSPWLATALVAADRRMNRLGIYVFPLLICAPFPFIGLSTMLFIVWLFVFCRSDNRARILRSTFSAANVLSFCSAAVLPALYLSSNMNRGVVDVFYQWDWITIFKYAWFLALEIGVFVLYLRESEFRNPWFAASLLVLVAFPCIYIGQYRDFGMRATIPPLFLLCAWMARNLLVVRRGKWIWLAVAIGAVGPICSMVSTIQETGEAWPSVVPTKSMYKIWPDFWRCRDSGTYDLDREALERIYKWYVYYGRRPSETVFFKYCARRQQGLSGKEK